MVSEVGAVQKSVFENKIEINDERFKSLKNIAVYTLPEESDNSKVKEKELVLMLLKEIATKKWTIFRIGRKLDKEERQSPVLLKFKRQTSKNLILENASKLKDSEVFRKVILSQALEKENGEKMKKLFLQKQKKINAKGGASGQYQSENDQGLSGSFHAKVLRRREGQLFLINPDEVKCRNCIYSIKRC